MSKKCWACLSPIQNKVCWYCHSYNGRLKLDPEDVAFGLATYILSGRSSNKIMTIEGEAVYKWLCPVRIGAALWGCRRRQAKRQLDKAWRAGFVQRKKIRGKYHYTSSLEDWTEWNEDFWII